MGGVIITRTQAPPTNTPMGIYNFLPVVGLLGLEFYTEFMLLLAFYIAFVDQGLHVYRCYTLQRIGKIYSLTRSFDCGKIWGGESLYKFTWTWIWTEADSPFHQQKCLHSVSLRLHASRRWQYVLRTPKFAFLPALALTMLAVYARMKDDSCCAILLTIYWRAFLFSIQPTNMSDICEFVMTVYPPI